MAQAGKRARKHRGTQAGSVDRSPRGDRPPGPPGTVNRRARAREQGMRRFDQPPTWRGTVPRAAIGAGVFIAILIAGFHQRLGASLILGGLMLLIYVPLTYYADRFFHNRRRRRQGQQPEQHQASHRGR